MAQEFVTDAGTVIIPSAVVSYDVQTANSGLATTGVLMLVGEADAGPNYAAEASLQDNSFGPDQLSDVIAKYSGGPIVDAFRAATVPANDPNITGSFSRIIIAKSNNSTKAVSALQTVASTPYNSDKALQISIADKSFGKLGNLIYYTITSNSAEAVPTTNAFTALLPIGTVNASVRVNGGAAQALGISALETPAALQSALAGLSGVTATGGTSRALLGSIHGSLTLAVISGNAVQITFSLGAWDGTQPVVGDTLYIPATSAIHGGSNQNAGSYVVTGSTANTVNATKLMDATGTPGTLTPPVNVSITSVVDTSDLQGWAPITLSVASGLVIDGAGKSLEIAELTTGTDLLSRMLYNLNTTKVAWVSKAAGSQLIVSGSEYSVSLNTNRQVDNIQENLIAGGQIALLVGYKGTTASLTINATTLAITASGGSGTSLSITLADFPTIQDVATFINSQAGYTASVGTAILGQLPSSALDTVAALGVGTTFGATTGRVKIDAFRFAQKVNGTSALVQLQDSNAVVNSAGAGLPALVPAITYLAGGARGSTADADITGAYSALEKVNGNFLVPLFSQDASKDIPLLDTDPGSTYTIAGVHAGARSHVLKMASLKRGRNRQAWLSIEDTFANAQKTAANLASFRCYMTFQDVRNQDASGTVQQYQPWMGAVVAAATQAAGFYKDITRKFANISGALQATKDFDDQDDDAMENALLSGLLPLRRAQTGGWYWVSDQSTYGKDSNFVFNSSQATYAADTVALTLKQRFENAFVGQSTADISAALALAFLEVVMEDLKRLKLISPSDDAPKGFKNPSIKLTGTAMVVKLEVKLTSGIKFISINFLVSQVQQSA